MTFFRQRLLFTNRRLPNQKEPIPNAANPKMNDEVLTELYEKYSAKVFNTANCIVKDEETANDIMQEVFITVWQKYETLREKEKVGAWMTAITVNKCKEYLRKQKREAAAFSDIFDDEDSSFEETIADEDRRAIPDEAVIDKQIKETLASLINELPEKQRMCMLMYYGHDRKISEIAEILEIPESTVKSCLNYGKKKLAAKVTELEKKGYILRGTTVAILPFLIRYLLLEAAPSKKIPASFVLHSAKAAAKSGAVIAENAAADGAASAANASGTAASTAGTVTESAASATTAAAGSGIKVAGKAAAAIVKFQAKSLAFKVVSGVAAASVLVGGGAVVGSEIAEKHLTENPPTAAVGEMLTDNDNPIFVDAETSSDVSESVSESTTNADETTTEEDNSILPRLFGEKETENTLQTSDTATTQNSHTTQSTAAQNQTTTTNPQTTEQHTTQPHTTQPQTTQTDTLAAENTEENENKQSNIDGTKSGGYIDPDDPLWE